MFFMVILDISPSLWRREMLKIFNITPPPPPGERVHFTQLIFCDLARVTKNQLC